MFIVIATLLSGGDYCLCAFPADSVLVVRGLKDASAFCVTPSGALYVLEAGKGRVTRYSPDGQPGQQYGGYGWGDDALDRPVDITAMNDLEIFVADFGNDRIVRFDRTLGMTSVLNTRDGPIRFRFPVSIALSDFGTLLVVDGENGRIIEIGKEDRIARVFGGSGLGTGFLRKPSMVRSDGHQGVIVRDESGLVVFDTYGKHIRTLGERNTGRFISFDHFPGGIVLVDSSRVLGCTLSGDTVWERPLPTIHNSVYRTPVAIRSGGDRIFVLYPDRIIQLPGPVSPPRGP